MEDLTSSEVHGVSFQVYYGWIRAAMQGLLVGVGRAVG